MLLLTIGDLPLLPGSPCLGSQAALCLHQLPTALARLQVPEISDNDIRPELRQMFIRRPLRQIWNDNATCATVADDKDQSDDIIRVNWELPVSSTILRKILRKVLRGQKIASEKNLKKKFEREKFQEEQFFRRRLLQLEVKKEVFDIF